MRKLRPLLFAFLFPALSDASLGQDICATVKKLARDSEYNFQSFRKECIRRKDTLFCESSFLLPNASECDLGIEVNNSYSNYQCDWDFTLDEARARATYSVIRAELRQCMFDLEGWQYRTNDLPDQSKLKTSLVFTNEKKALGVDWSYEMYLVHGEMKPRTALKWVFYIYR